MTKQTIYSYRILKNEKWQDKRVKIFNRDNYTCQRCNCHSDRLILHHISYESNLQPWEYPDEYYISVCPHCHAAIHEKLNNEKVKLDCGWQVVDFWDTNDYGSETCDYCGTDLRYVYVLYHPELKAFINVGETCADKLQGPKEIVASAKKFYVFLKRFAKIQCYGKSGELIVYKRIFIFITNSQVDKYYLDINNKIKRSSKKCDNIAVVKLNIYNSILNGDVDKFIEEQTSLMMNDKQVRERIAKYLRLNDDNYPKDCVISR